MVRLPHASLIAVLLLALPFALLAQTSIEPDEIPSEPGSAFHFHSKTATMPDSGIIVDIDPPGGNYQWDFSEGPEDTVVVDSLLVIDETPFGEEFPNATRVVLGSGFGGLQIGGSIYRYEAIADTGWYIIGLGIPFGEDGLAIPLALQLGPMPLTFEEEWAVADTFEYIFRPDTAQTDYKIELIAGGMNEVDAWGTAEFDGGQEPVDVLRIHSSLGMELHLYVWVEVWPFPGFWFEVPLPEGIPDEIETTQSYMFYAPDLGEIATISSFPGEQNAQFDTAMTVRRRFDPLNHTPESGPVLPETITLSPAYPNPFNAVTQVGFTLPRSMSVTLRVVDLLGREVTRLAEGRQSTGYHEVQWNAGSDPSGVYFIRLETPVADRTRKVILLR
ncbi:T9SS type A sorting domain-containing protein [bacterium]|nr:T9SS type A sorting domain-containing protein [bacterium]